MINCIFCFCKILSKKLKCKMVKNGEHFYGESGGEIGSFHHFSQLVLPPPSQSAKVQGITIVLSTKLNWNKHFRLN